MSRFNHITYFSNSSAMKELKDNSINLVVTSPPYPMIEMWDEIFSSQSEDVKNALAKEEGDAAFESMHILLDRIWEECYRVLMPGGFMCINIGDATRTINKSFRLYNNHSPRLFHLTFLFRLLHNKIFFLNR